MKKFVIVPGNNPGAIRRALLKRGGWEDVYYLIFLDSYFY